MNRRDALNRWKYWLDRGCRTHAAAWFEIACSYHRPQRLVQVVDMPNATLFYLEAK